jgi:DNA-binding NtrC family response regulator
MSSKRHTILVVDDEQSVTNLLSESLAEEGYNCFAVATGEDALEKIAKNHFDVMLLDLKLPGISGMDVLKKAISTCPGIRVIVVTASGDAQTAVEAMKSGAVDYITKPFELERVNRSIESVLKIKADLRDRAVRRKLDVKVIGEETDWMCDLDDVAEGVETRLDSLIGHVISAAVIEQTAEVARQMKIHEDDIEKWTDAKRKRLERIRDLDAPLAHEANAK